MFVVYDCYSSFYKLPAIEARLLLYFISLCLQATVHYLMPGIDMSSFGIKIGHFDSTLIKAHTHKGVIHKRCPQERGRGSSRSGHLWTWGEGGQAKWDVHIWLKFDKYLISNLS